MGERDKLAGILHEIKDQERKFEYLARKIY